LIDYAVELLAQWRPDAEPMLPKHYEELATYKEVPLEVHWPHYERAESNGVLRIYTARDDGVLIGYALFVCVWKHPHYRSISIASNDVIWIDPNHRGAGVATGLCEFFEKDLHLLFLRFALSGRGLIHIRAKTKAEALSKMLQARGYQSDERGHTMLV
jgi:GNAT superfamily N-acetyltransferase